MLPTPLQDLPFDNTETVSQLKDLQKALRTRKSIPPPPETRDLTNKAIWTVSTAKPGNGVEQLLDGSGETYWQSDGMQPHIITAQFSSKHRLSSILLFLDVSRDESYTPAEVSVRAGSNAHDMKYVRRSRRVKAPKGWIEIPLGEYVDEGDECSESDSEDDGRRERRERRMKEREKSVEATWSDREHGVNGELERVRDRAVTRAFRLEIIIHCNHHNGRDSRVRMVKILGPREQIARSGARFTSREFRMYETIR